jgi:hypothetical protein
MLIFDKRACRTPQQKSHPMWKNVVIRVVAIDPIGGCVDHGIRWILYDPHHHCLQYIILYLLIRNWMEQDDSENYSDTATQLLLFPRRADVNDDGTSVAISISATGNSFLRQYYFPILRLLGIVLCMSL